MAAEAALTRLSSLSGRKRLKTASRSSNSARTCADSVSVAPSTTTSQPMDSKTMAPGCRPSLNAS